MYIVSGPIDAHPNTKWFDYLFLNKTVNYYIALVFMGGFSRRK